MSRSQEQRPSSPQQQMEYAQQMLMESREELARAEGKAAMLLSATVVAFSVLAGAAFAGEWSPFGVSNYWEWMLWTGVAFWTWTTVELAWAAFPRVGASSKHNRLTYFRDVDAHHSVQDLRKTLGTVASDPLQRTADQLWNISRLVVIKYRHVQRAIVALGIGTLLLSVVAILEVTPWGT